MVVMMVMMVMAGIYIIHNLAAMFVAMFIFLFQFQGNVSDSVFFQFFPDSFLHLMMVSIGHDMHRGKISLPIHTPNVDMVRIQHPIKRHNMRF